MELARYENVWEQLPYVTSKGGQASFRDFTIRLKRRGKFVPDQNYYQDLIAKAILYRRVRQIVKSQRFQGFWANIADYTVAYISFKTAQRIDLKRFGAHRQRRKPLIIWLQQLQMQCIII